MSESLRPLSTFKPGERVVYEYGEFSFGSGGITFHKMHYTVGQTVEDSKGRKKVNLLRHGTVIESLRPDDCVTPE